MSSTHLSLHNHLVFSTKARHPWIGEAWRGRLHSYLGGILGRLDAVPEKIGGASDHVHILASLKATHRLADVMREMKSISTEWVHRVIGVERFAWQEGYGAFSVSPSEIDAVKSYIAGQQEHHMKKAFQEEYMEFLRLAGITIDERYLW